MHAVRAVELVRVATGKGGGGERSAGGVVLHHSVVLCEREREDVGAGIRVMPDRAKLSEVPDVAGDKSGSVGVDASDSQRGSRLSEVAEEVRVSEDGHVRLAVQLDRGAEDLSVGIDAVGREDDPVTVYRRTGEVGLGAARWGLARS